MTRHECPHCVCGLHQLRWSDRERWVDLGDSDELASVLVSTALDHHYDRGTEAVPDGLPPLMHALVQPIIAAHLTRVAADWKTRTVEMDTTQRTALQRELRTALADQIKRGEAKWLQP